MCEMGIGDGEINHTETYYGDTKGENIIITTHQPKVSNFKC